MIGAHKIRLRFAFASALFALVALLPGGTSASSSSDGSATAAKPKAGTDNTATFVRDQGDIAIIEITGNYDKDLPGGASNSDARAVVTREFLRTHPDAYDMLVVFTGFPINTGTAIAFYSGVQNKVQGIGKEIFDSSAYFGSAGKLQGTINMADLGRYKLDTLDKNFEFGMMVFAHEFMHQYGAYVKYRKPDGSISSALLGETGAHWSYLLDSNASVMYGSRWRDNGDGTFTATAVRDVYSPLDLYLAGLKPKEEVPPFFLIDAPGVDPTQLPLLGTTVTGTRRMVTIDDIIAAEGPRIPDFQSSQKEFRLAFVYAVRPGQNVSEQELAAMGNARRALGTRFSALTGGVAHMNVYTEPRSTAAPGTPAVLPLPSSPPATSVNVQQAVAWLKLRQLADGSWSDTAPTAIRDSAVSLLALSALDSSYPGLVTGAQWLSGRETASTDFLARKIGALSQVNRAPVGSQAADLLASQNSDGGWGAATGYSSNPLDTALAIQTLGRRSTAVDTAVARSFGYLRDKQNADGGWGNVAGGTSRTTTSAQVLVALLGDTSAQTSLERGKTFIAGRQNTDGGFGDSPSSVHDTANVIASLMAINSTSGVRFNDAMQYLSVNQRVDGSWLSSVYSTALAVTVLARANAMNWAITGLTAAPTRVTDGQRVTLSVSVTNTGNRNTPVGKLRVYAGDPAAGGVAIGSDAEIPVLVAGASTTVSMTWNTLGKAGSVSLYAVVDPERSQTELSTSDNTATLQYTVDPPSSTPDLLVSTADISVSPAHPSSIPSPFVITALLTNAGAGDASNVKVVLWEGVGEQRTKAGETIIASFPGRSTRPVEFSTTLTRAGATNYSVEIDPDKVIAESDETNNSASISVSTEVGIDLEVLAADIAADKVSPRNGEDVKFTAKLRNRGTVPTGDFTVRYTMQSPAGSIELATNVIRLNAGQQVVQTVPYRTVQTGAHVLTVDIDATEAVTEGNEANNRAQYPFTVASDTGPSLAVSFQDLVATPSPALEGSPLALSAVIRNVGSQAAANVEFAFYSGDPMLGGVRIGAVQSIPSLAAGTAQTVSANWANVPDAASKLIFVVVDPDNKIAADTTRDDNRAFITVPVKSLPDLAIAAGNLLLAPAVPKPGDSVSLQVRVDNLGQQTASDVLVRVYDGDPNAGGEQVGGDKVLPTIATQASAPATFTWTFPASAGDRVLHVRVDPLQAVNERIRTNNAAQLVVGVQSGDATVSTRYFSPNGDGVLDTVDFTFRLPSARTISIQVMNSAGMIVRRYAETDLSGISAGRFTWDGRNDTGSVVRDDSYRLQVVEGTAVFGEATVVVDTNHSSLTEAIGTPFALFSNLSCAVPQNLDRAPQLIDDGSRAYFPLWPASSSNPPRPGDLPPGIYRVNGFGSDLKQVLSTPTVPNRFWGDVLPTPDGTRLVMTRFNPGANGGASLPEASPLWTSSSEGLDLRSLDLPSVAVENGFGLLGFSPSGGELFIKTMSSTDLVILAVSMAGTGGTRTIVTLSGLHNFHSTATRRSPDGRKLLIGGVDAQSGADRPVLVDLQTGARRDLAFSTGPIWAPDSRMFAVRSPDGSTVFIYDAEGNLTRTAVPAVAGQIRRILWGDDSSELYLIAGKGENFCNNPAPCEIDAAIHRLSTASGQISTIYVLPGRATLGIEGGFTPVRTDAIRVPGQAQLIVQNYEQDYAGDYGLDSRWITLSTEAPYAVRPFSVTKQRDGALLTQNRAAAEIDEVSWPAGNFSTRFDRFAEFGRAIQFSKQWTDGDGGTCFPDHSTDYQVLRSLKNLSADLSVTRTPSILKLEGVATDAHFARHSLEYARTSAPDTWLPIAPVSTTPVISGELAQWVPPGPGSYLIRLTVEDLAGNRKQVVRNVGWGANSLISNLSRAPEYISPNGDGVQDKTVFNYRVLEPVNLVFNIYDAQGGRVATATRAHSASGIEATFEWDGRNTSGAVVADGVYKLTVLDYEFAVKVDTTHPVAQQRPGETNAPLARLALRLGEVNLDDNEVPASGVYTPHMALDWSVTDANFAKVVVQQGNVAVPTDWFTLLESNRNSVREPFQPLLIALDAAARQPYRVIASDLAGNATIVTLNAVESVTAANAHSGADLWRALSGAINIDDGSPGLTIEVVETVRSPIIEYAIEFTGPLADGELPGVNWSQRVLSAPTKPPVNVLPAQQGLDGGFLLNWDLRELTGPGRYAFRVRLTDQDGKIFRSADKELTKQRLLSIADAKFESSTLLKVVAEEKLGELVAQINLLVKSGNDPAFLLERVVWTRPGASTLAGLGKFTIEVSDRFQTCTTYSLRLQAVLADGRKIESDISDVRACTFAETVLKPNTAACGVAPTGTLRVELRAINQIQANVRLGLLEFGRKRANGTDDILFSQVNPTIGTVYAYELVTAAYAEGVHPDAGEKFFTRVTDIDNRRAEHPVRVVIDRTPAEARITYPSALQRICAKPETGTNDTVRSYVELEGAITDTSGFDYVLQYGVGEVPAVWSDVSAQPPACLTPSNRSRALGEPDSEIIGSMNTEARREPADSKVSCGPYRALSGTQHAGGLARLYAQHGEVSARLIARNWGGSQTCSQLSFIVDGKVDVGSASLDRTDIAPGRSDATGTVTLTYNADESLKTTVTIYRRADATVDAGNITGVVANAQPVRRLTDKRQVAAGTDTIAWNGRDEGNNLVEDGSYVMFVRFADDCGNLKASKPFVIVSDRTAPVVSISQPATGAEVGGIAEIGGSVSDANLTDYHLEFGIGADPQTWTAIVSGSQNVSNAPLGSWNTLGLAPGLYTLRLRAADRFGNSSEARLAVTVRAGGAIVSAFDVVPDMFSPNGDGRLDQTAVRFALVRAATVTATVYRGTTAVRILASNVARDAGAGSIAFDGLDSAAAPLADGRYEIELLATDGVASETVSVPVVIDRVAPVVTIHYPVAGFARGNSSIIGTIADANLRDYTLTLQGIDAPGINVVLDQGADVRTNYLFASLSGYAEGRYELIVEARDRTENTSRVVLPFEIDNTAPRVTLATPAANAVLGTKGNPFGVTAVIDERNLLRYRLNLGQGAPPAPQTELAAGTTMPATLIHALDIASLTDGSYTLQLIVDDKGGTTTTATTTFTVDKTSPTASISFPVENAYLRLGTEIKGVASDSNFQQYKLEVAPGTKAAASRFTEFAVATASVANGILGNLAALPPDGVHTIRLTVTDKAENAATALVQITVDTLPPPVPLNPAVRVENRQDVVLTWNAVTDADLAGYLVYRNGTAITQSPVAAVTFTDAMVSEGDHVYTVSAVDKAGNESARSAPVTARVSLSTPTAQILYPVDGNAVGGVIDIRGSAFSTKEFREYRVSIGEGATPTSFTLLRRSTISAQGEALAQWNTFALAENSTYTIQLEAEDTFGAVNRVVVTVRIDNRAPARPIDLQASLAASDVTLTWTANAELDLDGYLLYRNGVLVNLIGQSASDLKSYLIKTTTYLDKAVRDGTYDYTLVAMDVAGNQSEPSAPKRVVVESRTPKATIAKPVEGSRIDRSTHVLAISDDNDLASVQFQFRAVAATAWTDIGAAITTAPYGREWDLSALPLGDYELRAIAIDTGNRVDPAPAIVRITRARLDRPAAPAGLTARVHGEDVTLAWNAVTTPDLAGYVIEIRDPNGGLSRINDQITATTFTDAPPNDGLYHYTVYARDTFGNLSDPSVAVPARIFSVVANQPYTPTDERITALAGTGEPGLPVKLTITAPSGDRTLTQVASAQGAYHFPGIALELGDNRFVLVQTDAAGNTSREATPHVMVGNKPAKPTGLAGSVTGFDANLSWNANSEADLSGYYLSLDGEPSMSGVDVTDAYTSSGNGANVNDGDETTTWYSSGEAKPWVELQLAERALVSGLTIYWDGANDPGFTPAAFEILAWDGEVNVKVAEVLANPAGRLTYVALARPYFTDYLRIQVRMPGTYPTIAVSDVSIDAISLHADTSEAVELVNSRVTFTVSAVSTLGLVSVPSDTVELSGGDTIAPDPVTLQATTNARDVTLTWTPSASSDVSAFDILRDGQWLRTIDAAAVRTLVDSGLANGVYKYIVIALDAAGNRSVPSNEVTATVAVNATGQPLNLLVSTVSSGRALDLSWTAPASGTAPASYSVERSTQSGGPFEIIATALSNLFHRDTGLTNGSRYYYRVFAVNATGDAGPRSAEASAVPQTTDVPAAPQLSHPASALSPATVSSATATVTGFADPATLVVLFVNGAPAGSALARETFTSHLVESGSNARLSPDGAWTIGGGDAMRIVRNTAGTAAQPGDTSRTIKEFAGLNARQFSWAATSKRAAYVSERYDSARGEYVRYAGYFDVDELVPHAADAVELSTIGIATSPDGRYGYVMGLRDGRRGLWRIELATNTPTPLLDIVDGTHSLAIAPAGDAIAYIRDGRLEIFDLATGQVRPQGAAQAEMPSWTRAGDAVFYTATVNSQQQIFRLDFSGAPATQVTTGLAEAVSPSVSPDATRVAYLADNRVKIRTLSSGAEFEILPNVSTTRVRWVDSGYLELDNSGSLHVARLAGHFRVADVFFTPGTNRITATATLEGSPPSAVSAAAIVNYSTADRPDLAVSAADIIAIPGVSTIGERVRVTVTVKNIGPRAAVAASFALQAIGPNGVAQNLIDTRLPTLASGASAAVVSDWTPTQGGTYKLSASVDRQNEIIEVSESNNTAVRDVVVVAAGVPSLTVNTDASVYPQNAAVTITARVVNGGTDLSGTIELQVEDAQGFAVIALQPQPVQNLAFGQSLVVARTWNTTSTLPGAYRVRVKLTSSTGSTVTETTATFAVDAAVAANATVTTDLAQYPQTGTVHLLGRVTFPNGAGAGLSGEALLRVLDAAGQLRFEQVRNLAFGTTADVNADWVFSSQAAGDYTARIEVRLDGRVIASANSAFKIVGVTLLPPSVSLVTPANNALFGAPARIAISAGASSPNAGGTIAKVEFFSGADKIGEALAAPFAFNWIDVPAGIYSLTARATDNRGVSADTPPVNVTVNALPSVAITTPASGALFQPPATITVTAAAQDSDGTIAKIEIYSGSLKLGECAISDCNITWNGVAAGAYTLTAVATDNQGGRTTSAPVVISVGQALLPPTVSLTVPTEGAIAQAPGSFTLTASAASPNAGGSIAKVEFFQGATKLGESASAPYSFAWTSIPAGSYVLTARAIDDRGVSTDSAAVNVSVNVQPTVSITAPAANASFTAPASIAVTAAAQDSDGTITKIELFNGTAKLGECATSPCTIQWTDVAAGSYSLTAKATDNRNGSTISAPVAVSVGQALLPPAVSLTAPAEGAIEQAPGRFTLAASASSPNASGSIAKVEFFTGADKLGEALMPPYTFEWIDAPAGLYALKARATDDRGVTTDSTIVNVIVNAQPTVSITAPAANASFTAPATIEITAAAQDSDGTIAKIEVFNGATKLGECLNTPCTVQWAGVAAGSYTLTAKATDNRDGSTTSAPVTITVSPPLLAPTVAITSPVDGAIAQAPGSFTLIATAASPNAGGSIAKVEFYQGTTKLGESASAPHSFAWANIAAGSFVLTARATDNRGVTTDSAVVSVIVNAQPTASITGPAANASFTAPATIDITATAQDSDGTITQIEIFNGASKLGECLGSPCEIQWVNVAAGSYSLTAKATDNRGGSTISAPVAVSVGQALLPPTVTLTGPANGTIAQAPGSLTLSATAASPNAGGSISKVEFFQGTTKLGESSAAPYSLAWTNIVSGSYALTSRATDNRGVTSDSAVVNVIVNAQPTVSITAPLGNASYTSPATIAVTAAAQDSDGTIAKIEIFNGANKLGECLTSPCTVQWTGVAAGSYTLTAKATDNRNGSTISAPVAVSVGQALLPPTVSLTAPVDGAIEQAPGSFTLTATAASPNTGGSITKVEFFQDDTKLGETLTGPVTGQYSFAWTNITAGSYSLTARATDNRGVTSDSAVVNVIVNAQPTVSITAPLGNASYTSPATIAVTAAAQDSDGTIAKIEIFNGANKLGECLTSPCTVQWTGIAAGSYTLTAKATDNRNGSTTSVGVTITVAAGSLSGSVTVAPMIANIGQSVQVSANATSPTAVASLPLKVRIYNPTSGATLSEWTTMATLAASTQFLWSFNWDTTGQTAGTYKVAFTDRRTGSDVLISETTLTLKSAVVAQLSAVITTQSRVLVLATCNKSGGDNDNPDVTCAEQQKAFLEALLSELNVVHRVVTDTEAFRTELRCGSWNVFWLSGGREKLKGRLAEELAEQVYAGKGLIVDGVHDGRNNGLDEILGVKYKGKLANNQSHVVVPTDSLLSVGNFGAAGRAVRFEIQSTTAVVHARFDSTNGDPAIISNGYGLGRALTIAFDMAGTMMATPGVEANALPLFAKVAPTVAEPGATVRARLVVSNSGGAGSASVQAILPAGVTLANATPSPTTGTTWQLDFAVGGQRTIDLEFNVPAGEGTHVVRFESGSAFTILTLKIAATSGGTHAAVVQTLNALNLSGGDRNARDKAVKAVNDSAAKLQNDPESALYLLLDAAKELAKIATVNAGAAPEQLARLVVKTSSSWCQQIAACMRPDQGTAALGGYQVLVFGDAQFANGSVEGSVGASGNVQLANLTVASQWSGDAARVVAGANVSWGGGGSVGINGSGIILAGGNIVITPGVGRRSATSNTETEDWAGLETYYRQLSDELGQLAGTAALAGSGGKFTLKGTHPAQNVFTLTGTQTALARSLVFDVPLSSSVIVNVTGTSATFANGQQYIMQNGQQQAMQQHSFATHVLFNFPQATAITAANWAVQGSVLAPRARLSQSNGNLFGQLIIDSLSTSNMQFQQCGTFRGTLP